MTFGMPDASAVCCEAQAARTTRGLTSLRRLCRGSGSRDRRRSGCGRRYSTLAPGTRFLRRFLGGRFFRGGLFRSLLGGLATSLLGRLFFADFLADFFADFLADFLAAFFEVFFADFLDFRAFFLELLAFDFFAFLAFAIAVLLLPST